MSEADAAIASVLQRALAVQGLTHAQAAFGPMQLELGCDDHEFVRSVQRAAIAEQSAHAWPTMRVLMLTAASLPLEHLPTPLRPTFTHAAVRVITTPRFSCLVNQHLLWVADRQSATVLRWSLSSEAVPDWESTRPLRYALNWWAAEHGSALLHAGVVAYQGRSVILAGKGGTGKSTTVCACLDSPLSVLADDYCLVQPATADSDATAHALFRVGHVDAKTIALLPSLRSRVIVDDPQSKSLVRLIEQPPRPASIAAFASITRAPGADTLMRPTSASAVLQQAAPSTIAQSYAGQEQIWRVLTQMVQSSICVDLQVGSLSDVPTALLQTLRDQP